jgi:heat shock protein HslJ
MPGSIRKPIAVIALGILLAACVTPPTVPAPPLSPLEAHDWRLTAWSVSSLRATEFEITVRLRDGRVSGRSAVNTYTGAVTIGPGNAIAFGPIATTRMAGPEPAMRAEGIYLQLLGDARSWSIDDARLTLRDAGGNERLVFVAAPD